MEDKETALADQARAAAEDLLSRFGDKVDREEIAGMESWLRPFLATAWLEGRAAGGDEAKALVRRYFKEALGQ